MMRISHLAGSCLWLIGLVNMGTSAALAQDETEAKPPSEFTISANASRFRRHQKGTWSVVMVTATNPTDEPQEGLLSTYWPGSENRQIARQMWVPPHAKRSGWLPIPIPKEITGTDTTRLMTLDLSKAAVNPNGREMVQRGSDRLLTTELILYVDQTTFITFSSPRRIVTDRFGQPQIPDNDVTDTIVLARLTAGLPPTTVEIGFDSLPPWPEAMEGVDQLVISGDRLLDDAAGLTAIRAWIRSGGMAWILLDRTSDAMVSAVLGNSHRIQTVDRVELDRYELETVDPGTETMVKELCEYEVPVEMVRVLTDHTDIPSRVHGWPAEIWIPYGEGAVLVTPLAPRGFRRENASTPTNALRGISTRLFAARNENVETSPSKAVLNEQIGYRVPKRSFGMGVLGGYCLAMFLLGGVLAWKKKLDWLAVAVPAITLVTSGILLAAGARNNRSVEPTVVYTQILQVEPSTDEVRFRGLAATYDQQTRDVSFSGNGRNWIVPQADDGSEIRRWIFDGDVSRTHHAQSTAGAVGYADLRGTIPLARSISARAHFGPEGLTGSIDSGEIPGEDFVIVGPPAMANGLTVRSDGTFVASPDQLLSTGQYSAAALLTDEQRRRQEFVQSLMNPNDTYVFPRRPTLLGWRQPMAETLKFPSGFREQGSALLICPVEIERTPPGSAFQVSAAFLRPEIIPGSLGLSKAYNPRTGIWVPNLTDSSDTALRFPLPRGVVPCELTEGTVTIRMNIPSRQVRLEAIADDRRTLIKQLDNPSGVYEIPLTAKELMLDASHGIRLAVVVGDSAKQREMNRLGAATATVPLAETNPAETNPIYTNPSDPSPVDDASFDNSTWQIDYLRLSVAGKTIPPQE